MKLLVTGSSGRVGRRVAQRFVREGLSVRGIDIAPPPDEAAFEAIQGDLLDDDALTAALADVDCVVHVGAVMSWRAADERAMFAANVEATRRLLAACAGAAKRFVFASSGEVYPETAPRYLPIDEDHPRQPRSAYGLSKLLGEELVRFHGRTSGMETVVLRFSHTQDAAELLDPDSFFSGPRFFLRQRIAQQRALGNTAVVTALTPLDTGEDVLLLARNEDGTPVKMVITETRDIVAGVVLATFHPEAAGQTFNLGGDGAVDFGELVPEFARLTGLDYIEAVIPGGHVRYDSSNQRIREALGFAPQCTVQQMVVEAAQAWQARKQRGAPRQLAS